MVVGFGVPQNPDPHATVSIDAASRTFMHLKVFVSELGQRGYVVLIRNAHHLSSSELVELYEVSARTALFEYGDGTTPGADKPQADAVDPEVPPGGT